LQKIQTLLFYTKDCQKRFNARSFFSNFQVNAASRFQNDQWLRRIVVTCYIAFWFRSGAVLTFDQFYQSSFF